MRPVCSPVCSPVWRCLYPFWLGIPLHFGRNSGGSEAGFIPSPEGGFRGESAPSASTPQGAGTSPDALALAFGGLTLAKRHGLHQIANGPSQRPHIPAPSASTSPDALSRCSCRTTCHPVASSGIPSHFFMWGKLWGVIFGHKKTPSKSITWGFYWRRRSPSNSRLTPSHSASPRTQRLRCKCF